MEEKACSFNAIYISSNVMEVQKHLLHALENNGVACKLYTYTLHRNSYQYERIDNSVLYECNSIFRGPLLYINRLKRVFNAFKDNSYIKQASILHANMMSGDGYLCRLLSKEYHLPYVVSVRNTDIHLWFLWKLPWLKREYFKVLLDSEAIIFLNQPYIEKLLSKFSKKKAELIRKKCIVIPNGIDDYWLNNIYKNRKPLTKTIKLITAGRIERNKNQLLVAKAINELSQETDHIFEYTIIGDVKDKEMGEELKKYSFVTIKPFMDKEPLLLEFRDSDIYIMPSHTETFGLVYAEAMTQGLPLIYTKGQGFDKQFEDGTVGFPVNSHSIEEIKNAILRVANNYNRVTESSIYLCERFKWSSVATSLTKVYSMALNTFEGRRRGKN